MKIIRKANDRGHFENNWLKSFHSFSFGEYRDLNHMGFGTLRVINEDWVQPSEGFATHPHNDMEILTYVLDGTLEHKDSLGNGSQIKPGEIQRMSAGTGITHSEFNPSTEELVHLLQIWILPDSQGHEPGYEQITLDRSRLQNQFDVLASATGEEPNAVKINQNARMLAGHFGAGSHGQSLDASKLYWLQVARGNLTTDDSELSSGDGLAIKEESQLDFAASADCELILFELTEK